MTALFGKGLTIGFLFLFPLPVFAAEGISEPAGATITVRVWDRIEIDPRTLDHAKQVTENVFRPLRLEIRWVHCVADPNPQNQRCISPVGPNDVSVRIYRRPTEDRLKLCPDTAGFALPSSKNGGSGIINVFFDRLEQIVQGSKGTAPLELLLGITVAHEIGHLLLPGSPHSRSGIMHARVGEEYLHMAAQGWLGFTVEQRQAIGKNVREWRSQSESKQLASVSTLDAYNSW